MIVCSGRPSPTLFHGYSEVSAGLAPNSKVTGGQRLNKVMRMTYESLALFWNLYIRTDALNHLLHSLFRVIPGEINNTKVCGISYYRLKNYHEEICYYLLFQTCTCQGTARVKLMHA